MIYPQFRLDLDRLRAYRLWHRLEPWCTLG